MIRNILLFVATFVTTGITSAGTVLIEGSNRGKGYAWQVGNTCYIITPRHVAGGDSSLSVTAGGDNQGDANIVSNFRFGKRKADLTLLSAQDNSICDAQDLDTGIGLSSLLESTDTAVLTHRNEAGGVTNIPVTILNTDKAEITVRPISSSDSIFKGMSGSVLKVENRVAGMLHSVKGRNGRLYRQDYIVAIFRHLIDTEEADKVFLIVIQKIKSRNLGPVESLELWKATNERFPLSLRIEKKFDEAKTAFDEEKSFCEEAWRCESGNTKEMVQCLNNVGNRWISEREKDSDIGRCFSKAKKTLQCFNATNIDEKKTAQDRCEFAKPEDREELDAYAKVRRTSHDLNWKRVDSDKFTANYYSSFKNLHESKTAKCKIHIRGILVKRLDKTDGSAQNTDRYNIRLSPGQEKEIEGDIRVQLVSGYMPGLRTYRTCRWE